jgi:ATP-dependent Clp protease protease subunit
MLRLRDRLYRLMGEYTGKDYDVIKRDFDRNKWLFAEEAVTYGCADKVQDRAPERIGKVRHDDENGDKD